ncbi:unnamed protein product [Staurois parvus]|uniref:Uncharacterized protein n=1 Tax=Staurois parvus TaxID=386267 RepID=A0ABN9HET7_9NEOB|nr:unnamed protein product [Staurois parvus]
MASDPRRAISSSTRVSQGLLGPGSLRAGEAGVGLLSSLAGASWKSASSVAATRSSLARPLQVRDSCLALS